MLDIGLLEQYAALRERYNGNKEKISTLRRLLRRLECETVADTVKGSRDDYSYGIIKVSGRPDKEINQAKKRIAELEAANMRLTSEALDLEIKCNDWMETHIDQARIRVFLRQRYYDGDTWELIGRRIGAPPCTPQQAVKRYLKTH